MRKKEKKSRKLLEGDDFYDIFIRNRDSQRKKVIRAHEQEIKKEEVIACI